MVTTPEDDHQSSGSSTAATTVQPWCALWRAYLDVRPGESDADGRLQYPQDLVAQTAIAIEHVAQVLAALGADLNDTVKLGTWYRGDGTRAIWEPAARHRALTSQPRGHSERVADA